MTAGKTWAATGATAAMLAGGLLLGAPAAVAAPGDPACLQATAQLDAALAGAGLTPESLGALDLSAEAVAAAEAQYAALVEGAGGPSLQELEAAAAALMAAQESGDAEAVALRAAHRRGEDERRGRVRAGPSLRDDGGGHGRADPDPSRRHRR